jgi:hypothetical protein
MTGIWADATFFLAGPLEGHKIERFDNLVRVSRSDGTGFMEETFSTTDAARAGIWEIRARIYEAVCE